MKKMAVMKRCLALGLALLVGALLIGCSSLANTWDKTVNTSEGMYKKYVNPDPCVDLDQDSGCSIDELKLAKLFIPVDEQLGRLIKRMGDKDTFPDSDWTENLLSEFPWLNGVVVLDAEQEVLLKRPATPIKEANIAFVLAQDFDLDVRGVRWVIEQTPLGPEFYVVGPFYQDNKVQGVTVSHFDPRSLVNRSPDPQELIVFSPLTMIWAGKYGEFSGDILIFDWQEELEDDVQGSFEVKGREFVWLSRYVGLKPIVYAVERVPEQE